MSRDLTGRLRRLEARHPHAAPAWVQERQAAKAGQPFDWERFDQLLAELIAENPGLEEAVIAGFRAMGSGDDESSAPLT